MAQRVEAKDSLDDFPTPPWATRALIEHVIKKPKSLRQMSCLEPACGQGHMAKVLKEYFGEVQASDIAAYGYSDQKDFLRAPFSAKSFDWLITNPPFKSAEEFVLRARDLATKGVAILTRTVFIESIGRYDRLFSKTPPAYFAQFTERVPMVKGRLDKKASTATGYCWLVWQIDRSETKTEVVWIPPCRKALEKDNDYEMPSPNSLARKSRNARLSA